MKPTMKHSEGRAAFLFLLPNIVGFLLFSMIPTVASFGISFLDWGLLNSPSFVGLANYIELMTDDVFWLALKNTAYYSFIKVPLNLILSLLLAVLLNKQLHGRNFFRSIAFLPSVCSSVAVALIWSPLLESSENGLINHMLSLVGIDVIPFLVSPVWAMPSVILVGLWKELGYFMVIFLAGLQGISRSYYEAASIDGANSSAVFFRITIPLISPTTFFALTTSLIGSFQIFDLTSVLTKGGPANATNTLVMYIYQNGFQFFRMGYASSLSLILFFTIFVITLVQNHYSDKWVFN
ncbi:MAG: sugar ABC transporter permease [Sphaerochaeta associata]|jgi:multiple sugar transport system permease protein|nr:sugar ABC transporter permease [Sphaerochaeta associata]MEA5029353.1 sugar ABC transporter permease [Sphaerochaeta associata]